MLKKDIEFEPSAVYFQKQIRISERKSWTLIEQVRSTIVGGNILDKFWLEVLLAMTYILNLLSILLLNNLSFYKESNRLSP